MSKLKKILIGIIVSILVFIGFYNVSKAVTPSEYRSTLVNKDHWYIGKSETIGYQDYLNFDANHLYCVQEGNRLWSVGDTYKVKSIVRINGDTAIGPVNVGTESEPNLVERSITDWPETTNEKGETIEGSNNLNAKLTYVLGVCDRSHQDIREAVWWYFRNWVKKVGVVANFYGIDSDFASKKKGDEKTDIAEEAKEYARKMKHANYSDNTEKSNIKVKVEGNDVRVGPFNWSYEGKLVGSSVKVWDENNREIQNVTYWISENGELKKIAKREIPNGKKFWIKIPITEALPKKITKITADQEVDDTTVEMVFLQSGTTTWQNLIAVGSKTVPKNQQMTFLYDIRLRGRLNIIKVNSDNTEIVLNDIGFKFKLKGDGEDLYVIRDINGIRYTPDINSATEFITGKDGIDPGDGRIVIDNLIVGNYEVIETTNPHYGYKFEGPNNVPVIDPSDNTSEMIKNKQIYIQLSGYVYIDVQSDKQDYRNNLYRSDTKDDHDTLLSGVKVRLVDRRTGGTVLNDISKAPLEAYTADINLGDGIIRYYKFSEVLIDELANYYVEFTYDGLTYQNVQPITQDRLYDFTIRPVGSVAAETAEDRAAFNDGFSTIEGRGNGADTGVTINQAGQQVHNLGYDFNNKISTLQNPGLPMGLYQIKSTTDVSGYNLASDYQPGEEELTYINLGLYEREKPDLKLEKDLYNVRLSINGYNHVYDYAMKRDHNTGYSGTGFNVGVKWSSEYISSSYTRAIYESDIDYENPNDRSKELQAYITYAIDITNDASAIETRVNKVADYYDNRLEIVAVGRKEVSKEIGLEQIKPNEGTITETLSYTNEGEFNNKYNKLEIYPNLTIGPGRTERIYVQFKINREGIADILNDENIRNAKSYLVDNISEIESYSSFQNGAVYAGVDRDSNPGNVAISGETITKNDFDDTDISPALQLEIANARTLEGTVFLDDVLPAGDYTDTTQLMTGQIRQGDGQYKEGEEKGIPGVKVTLTEKAGSIEPISTTTDENGNFKIDNYIPGDYIVTYTWGDKTYTVQNYKGTIYVDQARYEQSNSNPRWWHTTDPRYSDAVDDYQMREDIDDNFKEITNATPRGDEYYDNGEDITMVSTAPTMGISVEYELEYPPVTGNEDAHRDMYQYRIRNIDFGIVERARQDISLDKRISALKISLANGRSLVDVTIDSDGKVEGTNAGLLYMPPSNTTDPKQGLVRIEMDSELMSGALLEVEYTITARNNSELDYVCEEFYKFGTHREENELVTITPSAVVDYLDPDWSFEANENTGWESIKPNDNKIVLAQQVTDSEEITNRELLYTQNLARPITPNNSVNTTLKVSKLLTSSQDIELDNEIEINKINKSGGADITTIPGEYVPGSGPKFDRDDGMAERVIITPNTGENLNFVLPITIVISAFVIIVAGVIFIKKKVLNK